jgi:hypothetical protein
MRIKANGTTQKKASGHWVDRVVILDCGGHLLNARLVWPRIPETGEIDLQVSNERRMSAQCA